MNDSVITVQGYVGGAVTLRQVGAYPVANFRVGCTPRRFDKASGEWVNGTTQWYTVNAWRQLGENAMASLRSGDAVVVHGRLVAKTWLNANDVEVTGWDIEATVIGHDLNRGTSQLTRTSRAAQQPLEAVPPVADAAPPAPAGSQLDWGAIPVSPAA